MMPAPLLSPLPASLDLSGIWLPLVTPLREGRIDTDALVALANHALSAGIQGVLLFGSTGEGNLLSLREKFVIVDALREAQPRAPLILGVGGVDTREVCATLRALDKLHPDGWLVPPPYYLCPGPEGVLWHYEQIAAATWRPVVLYNVPKRTGTALDAELAEQISLRTGCAAIKECDAQGLATLRARSHITALCGEDAALLDHFLHGGAGAISASAHIRPDLHVAIMRLARAGRQEEAGALFACLRPLLDLLYLEANPRPLKHVLAELGWLENSLRLPLTPASPALGRRLASALAALPGEEDVARILAAGQPEDMRASHSTAS